MIIQMKNGWTDHCTEGPCDLYYKDDWQISHSSGSFSWKAMNEVTGECWIFTNRDDAMKYVDSQTPEVKGKWSFDDMHIGWYEPGASTLRRDARLIPNPGLPKKVWYTFAAHVCKEMTERGFKL